MDESFGQLQEYGCTHNPKNTQRLPMVPVPVPRSAFRVIRENKRGQSSSWPVFKNQPEDFILPMSKEGAGIFPRD